MFFIHPVVQTVAILLSLYVFSLGFQRFRSVHLKQQATFNWKRHVRLGITTMTDLIIGLAVALTLVRLHWPGFLITGAHGKVGLVLIPLILFGLISGLYMNKVKKKRTVLPLLHGINNTILILLALSQIATGWEVLNQFVLG